VFAFDFFFVSFLLYQYKRKERGLCTDLFAGLYMFLYSVYVIISMVAAASENNVIGKDGGIPWDLPKDFKHFHDATKGKPIVMGRKTHDSIGRVLPGRKNIIVTRQEIEVEGCDVVHSIEEALALVSDEPAFGPEGSGPEREVAIIGGGEIYKMALHLANRIDLTRVHTTVEDGNAFFPEFSEDEWELKSEERHEPDEKHAFAYTFQLYDRK